jgi:hypothetical protein
MSVLDDFFSSSAGDAATTVDLRDIAGGQSVLRLIVDANSVLRESLIVSENPEYPGFAGIERLVTGLTHNLKTNNITPYLS